ncbi:hypothetical protein ACHAXR_008075 [Thalassiosira sp. AJA248-18]
MPPLNFRLKDVHSRSALATALGVDRNTLGLVTLGSEMCKTDGCGLPAALNNFHNHEGMFCLPTKEAERREAIRVLGIKSREQRDKILESPRNYKVAPWHYHPWHRVRGGEDGRWQLLRSLDEYKDSDDKSFAFPPPMPTPGCSSTMKLPHRSMPVVFECDKLHRGVPFGNGLCKNLERYSSVTLAQRKEFNSTRDDGSDDMEAHGDVDVTGGDNMTTSGDAADGLSEVADEAVADKAANDDAMDVEESNSKRRGRNHKLDWKTEYLVYCFYASPNPRSQMLRAYPKSMIRKFGHANIYILLDATECFADVASMKTVNAILYSAYKHKSTLKWLVGCDPIGATWKESITEGYPGSISDPVCTAVTKILDHIPFGCAVEVDKGFLIENECALLGIVSIRPMKMLEKQTQQSETDASNTQKVGKTRIVTEQANGQMKNSTNFFDKNIRIDQLGLADLIFRSSYLFQNFKLPFIQERAESGEKKTGRPCKAKIRWYGGTDDGLIDIRPMVVMWGCESEIARWEELRNLAGNESKSDTEISEEVLAEDWPKKLRVRMSCGNTTNTA